jgi:hypothetical protein
MGHPVTVPVLFNLWDLFLPRLNGLFTSSAVTLDGLAMLTRSFDDWLDKIDNLCHENVDLSDKESI